MGPGWNASLRMLVTCGSGDGRAPGRETDQGGDARQYGHAGQRGGEENQSAMKPIIGGPRSMPP